MSVEFFQLSIVGGDDGVGSVADRDDWEWPCRLGADGRRRTDYDVGWVCCPLEQGEHINEEPVDGIGLAIAHGE